MAGEAVETGECGHYRAPSGLNVDLKAFLSSAIERTVSYPPDSPISDKHLKGLPTMLDIRPECI